MPQIILKQPGQPVADFAVASTTITVAGVTVDCKARQLDVDVAIEIRRNANGPGEGGDGAYLAQISIPARRYADVTGSSEGETQFHPMQEPVPIDPNAVQVTLWPSA